MMFPKRFFAFMVLFTLAAMHTGELRAQWEPVNGQGGSKVYAFAVSGTNVFAATNAGVIRSTDSGTNWSYIGLSDARAFALHDTSLFAASYNSGISRSEDNGNSWTQTNSGFENTPGPIDALAALGANLFAGRTGSDGHCIYRSTDNGNTWHSVFFLGTITAVTSFAVSGSNIYAGTDNEGVFLSTDSGATWNEASVGLVQHPNWPYLQVNAVAASGTDLFVATALGFFHYSNSVTFDTSLKGLDVTGLALIGSDLFAGTIYGGIYRSTDKGSTWTSVHNGIDSATAVTCFEQLGATFIAGTETDGIYSSKDGGKSWTEINTSLTNIDVLSFAESASSFFAGTGLSAGVFRSTNNGKNWFTSGTGLRQSQVDGFAVNGTDLFAGTDTGIFLSTDNGAGWRELTRDSLPAISNIPLSGDCLLMQGQSLFAGTHGGVFLSEDSGANWQAINNGFTPLHNGILYIGAVDCFATNGTDLFAGLADGHDGSLYHSTDNGGGWLSCPFVAQDVFALALNDSMLVAGTEYGIRFSTDKGVSWPTVYSPLGYPVYALALVGTNIFAGTLNEGVILSTDKGVTWNYVSSTYSSITTVYSLDVRDSVLYAGTSDGIWRCGISELLNTSAVAEKPIANSQIRSYPNPFSQSTTISFSSQTSGFADVSIVNALGTEVEKLYSGELSAGEHSFTWNADGTSAPRVSNGMYECLVRMNGRVDDRSSTVETLPVVLAR
ncbi:MAG TPA: FlgD immunoglobulin-like domain containing protein [Candidatus Kapabacteria bacterium]|nr:FlgD immunoglobulin-like domain containing protein [Candidatus Kapabacteria bacterium]